ncbi:Unconventional myosin-IXb [Dermatophagoides pteronyssinus]|uniref:Unconventional myosin-IXb n=1 Tax=Dermatophagoides pteronyssinus TaxID=6956 RepID=A0ABQ8JP28_DERPT|nr:Unconventional myosin-IXb [Dermatophagoides pteronyssinus]
MMGDNRKQRYVLQVHVGSYSRLYEALSIEAEKITTAREIVDCICEKLSLTDGTDVYELAEVIGNQGGQDCKERRIGPNECPIALKLLWPKKGDKGTATGLGGGHVDYKFCLRRKWMGNLWPLSMTDTNDSQLIRDYFLRFLYQPRNSEYPDLCQLPDLTEQTLLDNLKARFEKNHIYTYVGSILIAVNPFTFYPIYNPKYVQLYQNRRLGDLPPHIFAIADAAYQSMLRKRTNQCIVISGESGSGKTESTNLLLHHLTALSQKGTHGTGVEQTILGAGPVLEAFGNAKTKFNNNSSRFGKFIQVNYKENGAVHGALVQKYLLEKSRIVSQVKNERNYHVFYYLLDGLSTEDKEKLYLTKPQDYFYLNQSKCYTLEGVDERHEFFRLTQSMEMVGFSRHKQFLCFSVLSAVLHLGNVQFSKKSTYHSDETVMIKNPEVVTIISKLLNVKEETLTAALTCKRTKAAKGEMLVINYKHPDAIATRDAMAKCLYGVLFDWIVMQVNHALLSKKDIRDHKGNSIGVLDIFGFEDFGDHNNFEQFCINYANERLQYYFNSHVFKYEQEEYQREGISWRNIDFNDNTECLGLIEDKPDGLLYLLDDQCNFPCGSNETIFQKFIYHHNSNPLFEVPPCRGSAFTIKHYAGKVKYQIRDFREKNLDLMRPDIVAVLKVSKMAFVRELVCSDPLALFRWHILKAFFKAYFHFTKLREISKMKRGLSGTYLVKEYANANQRRNNQQHNNQLSLIDKSCSVVYQSKTAGNNNNNSLLQSNDSKAKYSDIAKRLSSSTSNYHTFLATNRCKPTTTASVTIASNSCINHGASSSSSSLSCPFHGTQAHLCSSEARVLSRANKILMKKKYSSSSSTYSWQKKNGFEKSIRNFKLLKQLLGPPTTTLNSPGTTSANKERPISVTRAVARKQTQTVTHQFQQSLQQLMDTLSHANPFFVRCIKSNADKMPNHFDDRLVLQQLRYTGMLETVRIRQSGYSVRLTFDEFIQHYRILLPKGLLSSKMDVQKFLLNMKLPSEMYQIGKTKIFMRESEKLALDERLHEEILRRIINLQRWVRTWICRKRFNEMRNAAVTVQTFVRRFIAQKRLKRLKMIAQYENWAANAIQKHWRAYQTRKWFTNLRKSIVKFQACCRGHIFRKTNRMTEVIEECAQAREKEQKQMEEESNRQSSNMNNNNNKMSNVSVLIRTTPPNSSSSSSSTAIKEGGENSTTSSTFATSTSTLESFTTTATTTTTSITNLTKTDHNFNQQQQHRQLTKLSSDSKVHGLAGSNSSFVSSGYLTNSDSASSIQKLRIGSTSSNNSEQQQQQHITSITSIGSDILQPQHPSSSHQQQQHFMPSVTNRTTIKQQTFDESQTSVVPSSGPIQKAKATFRNIMGKSSSNSEINKRLLKQTMSVKSGMEFESVNLTEQMNRTYNLLNNKSLSNNDLGMRVNETPNISKNSTSQSDIHSQLNSVFSSMNMPTPYNFHHLQQQQQQQLKAKDENFTLLSRHSIHDESSFKSGEICAICENPILVQQPIQQSNQPQIHLKCSECKQLFHKKCIHLSSDIPCIKEGSSLSSSVLGAFNPPRPPRSKQKKTKITSGKSLDSSIKENQALTSSSSSNVQPFSAPAKQSVRVKQFTDPHDVLITDLDELTSMDKFISKKIRDMDDNILFKKKTNNEPKECMVDIVFKLALKEFKNNLISTYSVTHQVSGNQIVRLTYKDLIDHFAQILLNVCEIENTFKSFPVILGVNAFRGYMDELRNMHNTKINKEEKINGPNFKKSQKRKQSKKRARNKKDDFYKTYEHEFYISTANIYTVCEVCDSYVWMMERIFICRRCKLACHKKCFDKVASTCGNNNKSSNKLIFGSPLSSLVTEECRIPLVVEHLIAKIELKGLYAEGIYRKSARLTSITELKQMFDAQRLDIDLDHYSVHVLAGCLKLFFREMPEPLMTYELYDDFLWATTVTDPIERNQIIFNHISKLPKPNYDLLERLTFHLARVARQESANRMNANSLAIVFAPCILRTNKSMQMQDKLNDISKQTICIESIISEQMRQISDTLNDIDILDTACHTASSRLSSIRHSKMNMHRDAISVVRAHSNVDDEEEYLTQQISELITEKNHLTTILPTFRIASACSDEDILSSNENEEMVNTNASSDECLNSTVNSDNIKTLNTKTLKSTGNVNSNKISTTNLTQTKNEIR